MRANLARQQQTHYHSGPTWRIRARQNVTFYGIRDTFRFFRKNVGRMTSPLVAIFILVCLLAKSSWNRQEISRKIAEIMQEGEDVGAKEGAHLLDLEDTGTRYESSPASREPASWQTKDIVMETAGASDRRLGLYTDVKAHASASKISGCVTVSLKDSPVALEIQHSKCGDNHCPSCWICTDCSDTNALKLLGCSMMKISNSKQIGISNAVGDYMKDAMVGFVFINADNSTKFRVSDGSNPTFTNEIAPKSSAVAYCYTGGSSRFFWPSNSSEPSPAPAPPAPPTPPPGFR